jgi:hypothetical protein
MALIVKDRIKESTTTTGTGTITLAGATQGFQTFAVIGNANTTYYAILDGSDWEVGLGTYTSSGTTLSRDTILSSSNSGAAIVLSGASDVFCTYPSEKAVFLNSSNVIEGTNVVVEGNIASDAVTTNKIVNDAVTTVKILDANVTDAKIDTVSSSKLTGALPAIDGSALTSLTSGNLTGALPAIDGSALTGTVAITTADQTFTGAQRGTVTTDNDLSFDLDVTNNFSCTPTSGATLTFTNHTAGQSGYILLDNSAGVAITAAATTKINATDLATISTAGVYLVSYFDNGTNAYITVSATYS